MAKNRRLLCRILPTVVCESELLKRQFRSGNYRWLSGRKIIDLRSESNPNPYQGCIVRLILTVMLALIASKHSVLLAKHPGDFVRGLGRSIGAFGKASRDVASELDQEAAGAGRSLGGIYGKPAAQALTPDNHVAELYEPAAFARSRRDSRISRNWFAKLRRALQRILHWLISTR